MSECEQPYTPSHPEHQAYTWILILTDFVIRFYKHLVQKFWIFWQFFDVSAFIWLIIIPIKTLKYTIGKIWIYILVFKLSLWKYNKNAIIM